MILVTKKDEFSLFENAGRMWISYKESPVTITYHAKHIVDKPEHFHLTGTFIKEYLKPYFVKAVYDSSY